VLKQNKGVNRGDKRDKYGGGKDTRKKDSKIGHAQQFGTLGTNKRLLLCV